MNKKYDYKEQKERLRKIAVAVADYVNSKDEHYDSSWRRRSGPGAFFVISRKWDRIEAACEREDVNYDLFKLFEVDDRAESIINDVTDLIGYGLVLLEYMINQQEIHALCDEDIINILSKKISVVDRRKSRRPARKSKPKQLRRKGGDIPGSYRGNIGIK